MSRKRSLDFAKDTVGYKMPDCKIMMLSMNDTPNRVLFLMCVRIPRAVTIFPARMKRVILIRLLKNAIKTEGTLRKRQDSPDSA